MKVFQALVGHVTGAGWWKNFPGPWKFSRLSLDMWLGAGWWKNFLGPWKFSRLLWDLWLGAGWWKNFLGPWKFSRLLWKNFLGPWKFLGYCGTRRVRTCDRGRGQIDMELSKKKLVQQWRVSSIASLDTLSWKVYNRPQKLWAALNVFLVGTCIYVSCHCLAASSRSDLTYIIISLKFKKVPRSWAELALNWFENNRSEKLFQSSKAFLQDGVANSVISTSLIRGYQPRHLGWRRYNLPRCMVYLPTFTIKINQM